MIDIRNILRKAVLFLKREKIYIYLLIFVLIFQLSLAMLNMFLQKTGLDTVFEQEYDQGELAPEERIEALLETNPIIYFVLLYLFVLFVFFLVLGVIVDIGYILLRHNERNPIVRVRSVENARWGIWDLCKVAIIFLFAQSIMFLFDIFVLSAIPYLQLRSGLRLSLSATVIDLVGLFAVIYFVVGQRRQDISALGVTMKRFFANVRYGIVAYVGLIPVLVIVMFTTTMLFEIFKIPVEPQPVLVLLREEEHIPTLLYMCFFTGLFGPIVEEVLFRGFVYGLFKRYAGVFGGVVLSAAFFASIHTNLASFFPIFCLGILLAYLYEKTGSLISSITVHVIHNSVSLMLLLFIKALVG